MIEKLTPHYSFTTPATVHDEEALTALELAGRTAQKVNECVDAVNTIPDKVSEDVEKHIENGAFDDQIDVHTKEVVNQIESTENKLNARIDNVLGAVTGGSITERDAEVIDARLAFNGTTYDTLGTAIRESVREVTRRTRNVCLNTVGTATGKIAFNTTDKTITVAGDWYVGAFQQIKTEGGSISYEGFQYTFALWLAQDGTLYLTHLWEEMQHPADVQLCAFYPANATVFAESEMLKKITVNGAPAVASKTSAPANVMGVRHSHVKFDTQSDMCVTIERGIWFFDNQKYHIFDETKTLYFADYAISQADATVKMILDEDNELKLIYEYELKPEHKLLYTLWFTAANTLSAATIYAAPCVLEVTTLNNTPVTHTHEYGNKTLARIFKKVVCIGDSYTSGCMTDSDGNGVEENHDYAWPHFMTLMTGREWINCGICGTDVKRWLDAENGLAKTRNIGRVQAYVIGLAINDSWTMELGTAADIGTDAETYYGKMSQLFRELKTISPKAYIFIQTVPMSQDHHIAINAAIRDLVARLGATYNVHCIDLYANHTLYGSYSFKQSAKDGHPTALGYEEAAENLMRLMSEYIAANPDTFRDVGFIECD